MKSWRACIWALATLLFARTAAAQAGAYALFTGAHLDTATTTSVYGPTFGFYGNLPTPVVKVGGDVRGSVLNGGGLQHYNGVIGPRIEIDVPFFNLKPYGEVLIGFGSYKTTTSNTMLHVDYEYVGGIDRKLFSIADWRVLEFSYCNYHNGNIPTKTLNTGLILHFP
jgi:hypothetical protein